MYEPSQKFVETGGNGILKGVRRRFSFAISCFFGLLSAIGGAQQASARDAFSAYTSCNVLDVPQIVDVTPLAPGVGERTVPTLKGPVIVPISDGRRIMFAYPGEDFYANMKVEILPAHSYANSKTELIDNFEYVLASNDNRGTTKSRRDSTVSTYKA